MPNLRIFNENQSKGYIHKTKSMKKDIFMEGKIKLTFISLNLTIRMIYKTFYERYYIIFNFLFLLPNYDPEYNTGRIEYCKLRIMFSNK